MNGTQCTRLRSIIVTWIASSMRSYGLVPIEKLSDRSAIDSFMSRPFLHAPKRNNWIYKTRISQAEGEVASRRFVWRFTSFSSHFFIFIPRAPLGFRTWLLIIEAPLRTRRRFCTFFTCYSLRADDRISSGFQDTLKTHPRPISHGSNL